MVDAMKGLLLIDEAQCAGRMDIAATLHNLCRTKYKNRRSVVDRSQPIPHTMNIPPFSPTYCKPNEFPYSNFYVKLPNGNWMIRYRSGNRKILGTDELQGYLI
ncbi:hypothetical protein BD560DRAFT_469292 [Blakeslea trispora]|nr:hypothetical protein BD560DRAFT_469292 [Blakeslea trispora]